MHRHAGHTSDTATIPYRSEVRREFVQVNARRRNTSTSTTMLASVSVSTVTSFRSHRHHCADSVPTGRQALPEVNARRKRRTTSIQSTRCRPMIILGVLGERLAQNKFRHQYQEVRKCQQLSSAGWRSRLDVAAVSRGVHLSGVPAKPVHGNCGSEARSDAGVNAASAHMFSGAAAGAALVDVAVDVVGLSLLPPMIPYREQLSSRN